MLQLLTFLVGKLSLLFRLKYFESPWWESDDRGRVAPRAPPPSLQRGDLLEVPRTLFTHFGIYLGDNKVAHLIPDILPVFTSNSRLLRSVITNDRLILVDSLEDFAYGSSILVNRADRMMQTQPLPGERVAQRAERLLGDVQYSLLWNNCEHFVTFCRYGSATSRQTEKFCESLKSLIRDQRSVIITGLLGFVSLVCFGVAPSTTVPTVLIPFSLWMAG
uniref:Lecithin retinol acyltransferase a n=1 Tax=Oryzias latipes TaxID=8090 RepID=A0A3P9HY31_ORYLA